MRNYWVVIRALEMGLSSELSLGELRLTLGCCGTQKEVDAMAEPIAERAK